MSELKFTRENNEKYNTISINIENALIPITENEYYTMSTEKTKFGYKKSTIKVIGEDLKNKLKSWETEINEYLKNEVGTGPITILYGKNIYPKVSSIVGQEKEEHHIKVSGVWINENNKPFIQLWHVRHTN